MRKKKDSWPGPLSVEFARSPHVSPCLPMSAWVFSRDCSFLLHPKDVQLGELYACVLWVYPPFYINIRKFHILLLTFHFLLYPGNQSIAMYDFIV